jgi:hypothetical protein
MKHKTHKYKTYNYKTSRRNLGEEILDIGLSIDFFWGGAGMAQKSQATKAQINE